LNELKKESTNVPSNRNISISINISGKWIQNFIAVILLIFVALFIYNKFKPSPTIKPTAIVSSEPTAPKKQDPKTQTPPQRQAPTKGDSIPPVENERYVRVGKYLCTKSSWLFQESLQPDASLKMELDKERDFLEVESKELKRLEKIFQSDESNQQDPKLYEEYIATIKYYNQKLVDYDNLKFKYSVDSKEYFDQVDALNSFLSRNCIIESKQSPVNQKREK
jgi:hypothetical protein